MKYHQVLDNLCKLAAEEATNHTPFCSEPLDLDDLYLRMRLSPLACQIKEQEAIIGDEILPALFSPKATDYLKQLQNQHIFWQTVQRACIYQEIIGARLPISLRAVHLGYRRLVEEMDRQFGMTLARIAA